MADVIAARQAADAAAAASGVIVSEAVDREAQDAARALFDEVWPGDLGTQVTPNLLRALLHAGSYCSVATDVSTGAHVGAAFGFPGRDARVPGGIFLHSHMAGVTEGLRDRRIGTALKLHQRWWVMREGIPIVSWTFDPLVRRNAWFNLHVLGAIGTEYHENFYGPLRDDINGDDDSDRLLARWDIDSPRSRSASSAPLPAIEPRPGDHLVATPTDIVQTRRSDDAAARHWRRSLRADLQSLLDDHDVIGLTADGAYVARIRTDNS